MEQRRMVWSQSQHSSSRWVQGQINIPLRHQIQIRCGPWDHDFVSQLKVSARNFSSKSIETSLNKVLPWLLKYFSDFGSRFDIRQIRVESVTSRPKPQFVKLDYWDDEFGSGDWQRYIDMSGSDNIGNGYFTWPWTTVFKNTRSFWDL